MRHCFCLVVLCAVSSCAAPSGEGEGEGEEGEEGEGEEGEGEGEGEDRPCGLTPSPARRADGFTDVVYLFRAEAGPLEAIIDRRFVEGGVGESAICRVAQMGVSVDGVTWSCSTDVAYENTHHNWADRATVVLDGATYELRMDYEAPFGEPHGEADYDTLVVDDAEPIELDFVAGS